MKLFSPKYEGTRPIIDRVKESLFSVLEKYGSMEGKNVADLFCGVGSLGLEALSRGARQAVFIERNRQVIATLRRNIAKAGFGDRARVMRANAFSTGAVLGDDQQKYDFVFVDPPYADSNDAQEGSALAGLLGIIAEQICAGAVVIVRTHRRTILLDEYGPLRIIERREWGTMAVSILGLNDVEQAGGDKDNTQAPQERL